ncbi:response regulator [Kamptonema cortianum]|nr:response regulator [Oscillatoria laete-virens]MDK3159606.1 response regulator [Kamptonema cortianum]MDL5048652.1 response regulator [Oscillatoria amoena NRMC-F 0135]MDL5053256.1 response regulator [Oscillatoria laete-virens NRMC-F 0139]
MLNSVLLVDDDKILTRIYTLKLTALGFAVRHAPDGQTALQMISEVIPDAVILDIMLPDVNGLDILTELRNYAPTAQTPVLMFSAACSEELEREALERGATCILDKSVMTPRILGDYLQGLLQLEPDPTHPVPAISGIDFRSLTPEELSVQEEQRKNITTRAPGWINDINRHFLSNESILDDPAKIAALTKTLHVIGNSAAMAGYVRIARLAAIIEKLLSDIAAGSLKPNLSFQGSLFQAIETLSILLKQSDCLVGGEFTPSILAVDDDALSRTLIHSTMQKIDLNAMVVANAELAMELLQDNAFSLIMLDMMMPGMNGDELCRKIRLMPRHAQTPVIFVTGVNNFLACTKILGAGGNDLVCKPYLPMELSMKAMVQILRHEFRDVFKSEKESRKTILSNSEGTKPIV